MARVLEEQVDIKKERGGFGLASTLELCDDTAYFFAQHLWSTGC